MAVATGALIGGALLAGAGGAMQAREQSKAARAAAEASKFNPWDIRGAGGMVTAGPDGTLNVMGDGRTQQFQNLFGQRALDLAGGGGFGNEAINFASMMGNQMPGIFNNAQMMSDPASALAAGNMFSNFAGQNALFGQQQGMNMMGLANQFGQAGQFGANANAANQAEQFGLAALGNTDFSQLAADQVARMRTLARPAEERAVNAKFQNLFNRGTLSATSGERQIGELAQAQEMADISRINVADQFAQNLKQMNQNFGINALGQAFSGRAQDANFNLGAGQLFGNLGQGMLNFGQGAGQAAFNTQFGLNELVNSRGQQRLANATNLMGFGSQLEASNFNNALGFFGANRGINADMRALMNLSMGMGSEQSMAGARSGQFAMQGANSPFGSFLGGFGGGMVQGALGGAFGKLPGAPG